MTDRMSLEQATGCSGMRTQRSGAQELYVSARRILPKCAYGKIPKAGLMPREARTRQAGDARPALGAQGIASTGVEGLPLRLGLHLRSRLPRPRDRRRARMPYANTGAMSAHLAEISRHVSPGAHAILIVDGAGWHSSMDLAVPANITLLTLPPYSPELNPVENIWRLRLRHNHLANRVFDSYDASSTSATTPGMYSSISQSASPPSPHATGRRLTDDAVGIRKPYTGGPRPTWSAWRPVPARPNLPTEVDQLYRPAEPRQFTLYPELAP